MKQLLRVRFLEAINVACLPNRKTDTPLTNSEADMRLSDDGAFVEIRALPGKGDTQVVTIVPREHIAYAWASAPSEADVAPSKPVGKTAKA